MPGPYIIMLVNQRADYPHKYPFAEEGSWNILERFDVLNERVRSCYDEEHYEATLCDPAENSREYTIVDGANNFPSERGAIWRLTER
jgi:hypothetical protein